MWRSAPALALFLVISARGAYADDACPKVTAAEVEQQWQRYAPSLNSKLIQYDELECVSKEVGTMSLVCHTRAGMPAHPSIVRMLVLMRGGSIETKVDGQTAGDCSEFRRLLAWFKSRLQIQEKDVGFPFRP